MHHDPPMTFDSKAADRMLARAYGVVAIGSVLLAADAVLRRGRESEGVAFGCAAAVSLVAALVTVGGLRRIGSWLARHRMAVAVVAWSGLAVLVALAFAPDGWDEGAYLLSGLALRGFSTPYAAHRAPSPALSARCSLLRLRC